MLLRRIFVLVAIAASGCQLISGVGDLEVTASGAGAGATGGGTGTGASGDCDPGNFENDKCGQYCLHMCENCNGEQYQTDQTCMGLCALFDTGGDIAANTFACHDKEAIAGNCLEAGPSGESSGDSACGDRCENFCNLEKQICGFKDEGSQFGVFANSGECMSECDPFTQDQDFDVNVPDTDTFECRLKHLLVAITAENDLDKGNFCAATGPASSVCHN
jgi:hypothetical protein